MTDKITPQRWRKKPVVIEAMRWTGANFTEVCDFLGESFAGSTKGPGVDTVYIDTLEGTMAASCGDWIIRGVKGEHYPCKSDIFEATYEPEESPHGH